MMHRLLLLTLCLLLAAACSHHRSTVKATVDSVRTSTTTHLSAADCTVLDTQEVRAVKHDTVQHSVQGVVVKRGDTLAWKLTALTIAAAEQRLHAAESNRLHASEQTYEDDILRYMVGKSSVTPTRPQTIKPWAIVLAVVLASALIFSLMNRNK